ncbi:MAG: hypothetical protein LIP05_01240 [Tannerellaceae bacterium]|nr:hypothetical protein [Tannerellaceae bacterium]
MKQDLAVSLGEYKDFFIHVGEIKDTTKDKIKLIEFLITDSIFALSKTVETISPSIRTTLFSESYMAGIYHLLFECNNLFEFVYLLYKWGDEREEVTKAKTVEELKSGKNSERYKIGIRIRRFYESRPKKKHNKGNADDAKLILEFEENIISLLNEITGIQDIPEEKYSEIFFKEMIQYISKADIHMNIANYHAEMALRQYKKASEMHREGAVYKEMISDMHFLLDDLSNDTCQFYFSVERYWNNCGLINSNLDILKSISKNSSLLYVNNYISVLQEEDNLIQKVEERI